MNVKSLMVLKWNHCC